MANAKQNTGSGGGGIFKFIIIAVIIGVVLLVVKPFGGSLDDETHGTAEIAPGLSLSDVDGELSSAGYATVTGTVTSSMWVGGQVSVVVGFYGSDNALLGYARDSVADLKQNEKWQFEAVGFYEDASYFKIIYVTW